MAHMSALGHPFSNGNQRPPVFVDPIGWGNRDLFTPFPRFSQESISAWESAVSEYQGVAIFRSTKSGIVSIDNTEERETLDASLS